MYVCIQGLKSECSVAFVCMIEMHGTSTVTCRLMQTHAKHTLHADYSRQKCMFDLCLHESLPKLSYIQRFIHMCSSPFMLVLKPRGLLSTALYVSGVHECEHTWMIYLS